MSNPSRPTSFQYIVLRALSALIRIQMNIPGAHDYGYQAMKDINEAIVRGYQE